VSISYDPFAPEMLANPYPVYEALRRESPVHRLPQYDAVALACFEEIWQVIGDALHYTIVEGPVFVREQLLVPFDPNAVPVADAARTFATWDPPLHTKIRAAMARHFGPGSVAKLEERGRTAARKRLRELVPQGRFDVARDYAAPVSVELISRIIGLPVEDGAYLTDLVNRSSRRDPGKPGFTEAGMQAQAQIHSYILEQVGRRRARGADGTTTLDALLVTEVEGAPLRDVDIATQLLTLLAGGVETMPKIIAGGARELALAPDQRAALAADPSLAKGAFEEMVRHQGVLQHVGRTTLAEVEIGAETFPAGQRIFCLLQSGNRDEREFDRPDTFDIHRKARRHLGLGHGPHHCIGAHIARLEGRLLVEELVRAVPEYGFDEDAAERPASDFQLGYTSLPLVF
jgi:cytochrome P450